MTVALLAPLSSDFSALLSSTEYDNRLPVLDNTVLAFLAALSDELLSSGKDYSELVALGFWLRKRHLQAMTKDLHHRSLDDTWRVPLGTVVHYTPANVDTMFIYSWVCSLLMGNRNIVRISSDLSPLQRVLLTIVNTLFAQSDFTTIAAQNTFIQYPKHDDQVAREISLLADARLIWGGDESVNAIRQLPTKPRCRDISFADRYSAAVINASQFTPSKAKEVANLLWRDLSPYAQQACSSPKVLYWLGDTRNQNDLFTALAQCMDIDIPVNLRNEQLVQSQLLACAGILSKTEYIGGIAVHHVNHYSKQTLAQHVGQFSLLCIKINDLSEVVTRGNDKQQTVSYWGVDKSDLFKLISSQPICNVDRLVPIGQALDFSPVWDGFELFGQLTRMIHID